MRSLLLCLLAWTSLGVQHVCAKAVFAHFMLGNTENYTTKNWESDINLAKESSIDGFVLNMARNEKLPTQIYNAFTVSADLSFKLLFSFDYAANGSWPKSQVLNLLNEYSTHPAYYMHNKQPLVSTFEGPDAWKDWQEIKEKTNAFFIPDWSSVGPAKAANRSVVDGLFSWGAWPEGPRGLNTSLDDAYIDALDGKAYMMPVSPWFYTNMPGFEKNWVWRGDELWTDRWAQVMDLDPEFVQIISWNDYGESHYIGPIGAGDGVDVWDAFGRGEAPYNYAKDVQHDGWRTFLPYWVQRYKANKTVDVSEDEENVVTWYRLARDGASGCKDGGTTGNAKVQGQKEYKPEEILRDRIFYAALLGSPANVSVKVGGAAVAGTWDVEPEGGKGVYTGSVEVKDEGDVKVVVKRGDDVVAQVDGEKIRGDCEADGGYRNFNPWVGTSGAEGVRASVWMSWCLMMLFCML
ncbi:glycosyl hydrolase family 71 protein [Aspergillus steynii IBT 23096]|uniref:Glycosyl hydrolase family 71 protein n=1 Tax=Aspergillus steynii IBT 23096 TaxID=1392250 RepID=A0A2I2FRS2_9EURO|nr:glycosyl hydrolase family 71 protein [Aspergillus steynii IBT 23096]PLB43332.1 glycosyl hydrolase family 71 protein [Aspergillus steynii IBT 23096]